MSRLLQDFVAYIVQLDVYEKSIEFLEKLTGVKISAMQSNKITDFYGGCCDESLLLKPVLDTVKKQEFLYVEVDGSMLFTRDEGWKEVKTGRIFKQATICLHPSQIQAG